MSVHRCQAVECMESVPGNRLMCSKHWALVPESIKVGLFYAWNAEKSHDEQSEPVENLINMAVQQVAIIERKVYV